MAARKKKKKPEGFSAEDVTKSLNPEVTSGDKKMPGEVAGLRSLSVQAVKEKKYIAVKQLLETFDECGAISPAASQGGTLIFPKIWDFGHFASLIENGNKARLPEDYKPKLSKIGEREKAKREAAYQTDIAEMKGKLAEATKIANEAAAGIRNLPDPYGGFDPGLTTDELIDKMKELDDAKRNALLERQDEFVRLADIRELAFDTALNAVASFNKKWGKRFKLDLPGRIVGYQKPPKHAQFKKGQSGNPRGRPSAKKTLTDLVKAFAYEEITIKEGGRETTKPIIQVVFDMLTLLALTGDTRAVSLRRKYLKKYDPARQPKAGHLIVPEQVTVDETMEGLEEHRKRTEEAMARLMEEDEKLRRR